MLILLQPGIEPLGQFDIQDSDISLVRGGEVAIFQAIDYDTDGYAADVFHQGPSIQLTLGDVATDAAIYGLVDEGTVAGTSTRGYGTMFGTVIGTASGQGTGFGSMYTTGAVVVGPSTMAGSGKATLWTKPGLYGVTEEAWASQAEFDAATLNAKIYGSAENGTVDGKLTTSAAGADVALVLGLQSDHSLVSTTTSYAGITTANPEFCALYLLGVQS